jgi:cytoskeletal protein CcmA (bactofilin family)
MFKKSEESEWTRFSRALGNRDEQPETEETPQIEAPESFDAEPTMVVPPTPVEPPAQERVAATQPAAGVRPPEPVAPAPPASGAPESQPVYAPPPPHPPAASMARAAAVPAQDMAPEEDDAVDEEESIVGDGTEVEGTLRSRHSLRILGSVQGEIESRGKVTIEPDATVNAKISAENISIKGVVNGDLTCPGRIEISDTGRLIGGISGGILVMEEGAYFEGTLKMSARRTQRDQETDARADADPAERPDSLTDEQL